jgi:hypothetical protein
MLSSCPLQFTRVCSLAAVLHLPYMRRDRCVLSSTGCLPAQVGCGRRTRTPRHICGALCRTICPISACAFDCAPIFAHSRALGAQLDQSTSGQYARRLHRNSRLEHVNKPSTTLRAACGVLALLAPPARKSSGFGPSPPPCARYGAHGWPARRAQPRLDGFNGARPLHPARVASGKLWSAPPAT